MNMFQSSAAIRKCAEDLIADLQDLEEADGTGWTDENFRRLEKFAERKNPELKSYYKTSEFLWDFIAGGPEGIFLVAESEQAVHTPANVQALKHDFEKLLYVYSPIRILITKAKDRQHAQKLADELAEYASGCCLTFNPGASFILHFGLYNGGNVSYHWQSAGEPKTLAPEKIDFQLATQASQ